jgi:hypothetical protein
MKIIKIINSPKKNKRYRVFLDDNSFYDFGLKNPTYGAYIDHHDKTIRDNYRKRHLNNKNEFELITNLTPSPSLFSYYVLWGDYININDNIKMLNNMFKNKKL